MRLIPARSEHPIRVFRLRLQVLPQAVRHLARLLLGLRHARHVAQDRHALDYRTELRTLDRLPNDLTST